MPRPSSRPRVPARRRPPGAALAARALALLAAATLPLAAAVHHVGPGDRLASVPALRLGDVVEIAAGTYHDAARWSCPGTADAPITIRGAAGKRPLIDATGVDLNGEKTVPRACLQIDGVHTIVEHLEFANARNGDNGSGFRSSSAADSPGEPVVLRDCVIHDCDMGIQADGGSHLLIDGCEIHRCGTAKNPGASHNLYIFNRWVTVRGCWIHDSTTGYDVKTRSHFVELLYNLIADAAEGEVDLVDSDWTGGPDSNAVMIGNVLVSKDRGPKANGKRFILFGGEGKAHRGTLYAFNNTCIAGTEAISFFSSSHGESAIIAANNLLCGSGEFAGQCQGPFSGLANWCTVRGPAPDGFLAGAGDPLFVDAGHRDFRLTAASPCRDLGLQTLKYRDGGGVEHKVAPESMFTKVNDLARRGVDGRLDIGAYEFGGSTKRTAKREAPAPAAPAAPAAPEPPAAPAAPPETPPPAP